MPFLISNQTQENSSSSRKHAADAGEGAVAADEFEGFAHAGADAGAGQGDAEGLGDCAGVHEVFVFGELLHGGVEGVALPVP
jgi:hypothetical protein